MNMNTHLIRAARALIAIATLSLAHFAYAGPGAHGPDGEHLDSPNAGHAVASSTPMLEAQSDSFELVATLNEDELSVLIDRFSTNEPVLQAKVEVEMEGIRAAGTFHADHGDYAFTDEKLLQKLREPGEHALVFTVQSSNESDLLAGTLRSASDAPEHRASIPKWIIALGVGLIILVLLAWLIKKRQQRGAMA